MSITPELTGRLVRGRLQRHLIDTPTDAASGALLTLTDVSVELRTADGATSLLGPVTGAEDTGLSGLYTTQRGRPARIYVVAFTTPADAPAEVLVVERWTRDLGQETRRTRVAVVGP